VFDDLENYLHLKRTWNKLKTKNQFSWKQIVKVHIVKINLDQQNFFKKYA
jgi:hypothetical protein